LRAAVQEQRPPFVPSANGSIELLELPFRHGSARAIQAAFDQYHKVQTPLVMVAQHDNFFVQEIPYFKSCVHAMVETPGLGEQLQVQCLHFLSTSTLQYKSKVQKRYGIDIEETPIVNVDDTKTNLIPGMDTTVAYPHAKLVPLIFWYGRTHLSYTQHYQNVILKRPLKPSDHLEELWGVTELHDIQRHGMEAHESMERMC
jgi:hypothetical protein